MVSQDGSPSRQALLGREVDDDRLRQVGMAPGRSAEPLAERVTRLAWFHDHPFGRGRRDREVLPADADELAGADRHGLGPDRGAIQAGAVRGPRVPDRARKAVAIGRAPVFRDRDDAVRLTADVGVGQQHVAALPGDGVLTGGDRHDQARVRSGDHPDLGHAAPGPAARARMTTAGWATAEARPGAVPDAAADQGGSWVQPGAIQP